MAGWWFQIFFIFIHTWGRFPFWLIFFKGVETTNQMVICPWWNGKPYQMWHEQILGSLNAGGRFQWGLWDCLTHRNGDQCTDCLCSRDGGAVSVTSLFCVVWPAKIWEFHNIKTVDVWWHEFAGNGDSQSFFRKVCRVPKEWWLSQLVQKKGLSRKDALYSLTSLEVQGSTYLVGFDIIISCSFDSDGSMCIYIHICIPWLKLLGIIDYNHTWAMKKGPLVGWVI